jgi:hypothetical protein
MSSWLARQYNMSLPLALKLDAPRCGCTLRCWPSSRTAIPPKPLTASRDGFSLNCAVACEAHERAKQERVCRPREWTVVARGSIAQDRLSVDGDELVVLELKRAFSDGTSD